MVNPFEWISNRVRASVVAGFAAGLDEIDPPAAADESSALQRLQERMRPALAAPADRPARRGRTE